MSAHTFSRPSLLPDDPLIPAGNYDTWSAEETAQAEVRAQLFAIEYIRDWSAINAAVRLGVDPALAKTVGQELHRHWLTCAYVEQLQDRFIKSELMSRDRLAALMARDASNFGAGANAQARVGAQKNLMTLMGCDAETQGAKARKAADQIKAAGVMFVPLFGTEDAWEALARQNQDKIREEADSDDDQMEGVELL